MRMYDIIQKKKTGKVLSEDASRPTRLDLEAAAGEFLGEYMQVPPMVSAVKIGGKKLYEYAREGKVIDRPARKVFVHRFTLCDFTPEEASFVAEVSKGTYIRTLLTDLCAKVGCLGTMSQLERVKSGSFLLENSITLEKLEQMTMSEREGALVETERLFEEYPICHLPRFYDKLIANGQAVDCRKLAMSADPVGRRFRLYRDGAFFALGEVIGTEGEERLFKIKDFPSDPI